MTADEVKELVLQAGLELLDRDNLRLHSASIGYSRVFAYLKSEHSVYVTRGSVHERIWASQDDFRRDVLAESIRQMADHQIRLGQPGEVPATTPEKFARHFVPRYFEDAMTSSEFAQVTAAKALASRFDEPQAIDAIRVAFDELKQAILPPERARFQRLITVLNLVPRPELGLSGDEASDILRVTIGYLFNGGYINQRTGSIAIDQPVALGTMAADSEEPWRIVSVGVKCLIDFLFEPAAQPTESDPIDIPDPPAPPVDTISDIDPAGSSRRPRSELKRLVLSAAVELLLRDGNELKPDLLGYKAVFAYIKETRGITIHRATVHRRLWASNEEYFAAVLTEALRLKGPEIHPADMAPAPSALDTAAEQQQSAYDSLRNLSDAIHELTSRDGQVRRVLQVKATFFGSQDPAPNAALLAAVHDVDRSNLERYRYHYETNVFARGFRLRPELALADAQALEMVTVLTSTIIAGSLFNKIAGFQPAMPPYPLPRLDDEDNTDDWSPVAIALRSFVDHFYVHDAGI